MVTQDVLKKVLNYDNGHFYWKISGKGIKNKGCLAGCLRSTGYIAIRIGGKLYQAHNIAWLYVYGEYIPGFIDHVNGNRSDNRIENLRMASKSENCMNRSKQSNNSSGETGVFFRKDTGKWMAYIGKGKIIKNGKTIKSGRKYLGCFATKERAVKARKDAEIKMFAEFSYDESRGN